ncbi:helix-turn-helix transcriptional regulator [Planobispora siamensis]|uniref:HTH luxR-type domain-containing protein n=1 Tax=Planobispora siamensis TaxID=936338 RepID=A0A8J3WMX5_9ACTN|nr:LuxR C-terminal-related transcriptional regulator [Planobispora siamensis]GIH95120.1 hypothetical protein Psi01_57500 [Planobispora siamensis]
MDEAAAIRDALTRVIEGESVIDGEIISRLFARRKAASPLDRLTGRERSVLTLMAEGRSDRAIGRRLHLGVETIEGHIAAIFTKLDLESDPDDKGACWPYWPGSGRRPSLDDRGRRAEAGRGRDSVTGVGRLR